MNVVVQRARHPQLRYYIHATVAGLLPFVQKVGLVWQLQFFFSSFLHSTLYSIGSSFLLALDLNDQTLVASHGMFDS